MKILVLGAGGVGTAIASDLSGDRQFEVTVADRSEASLSAVERRCAVRIRRADLSDRQQLDALIEDAELVVGALPSFLGFSVLESAIAHGRNCVDVSFLEEEPLSLDDAARSAGVTLVVDSGLAPGLSNLLLGFWIGRLEAVESFVCYVGGLPQEPQPPWSYKAPFSPCDVLAEYTRPARFRVGGRDVVEPALSGREELEFEGIGRLEAFNTDGLRTLMTTVPVPDMVEKTLRYPGYAAKIELLRDSGFLSSDPVDVAGTSVSPLALTSELLFEQWRFDSGEPDVTVMRVEIEGSDARGHERHRFDLVDRFDAGSGLSSMARTTGFTCAAVARLVARGRFRRAGVSALEHVGMQPECYRKVLEDLGERGVHFRHA